MSTIFINIEYVSETAKVIMKMFLKYFMQGLQRYFIKLRPISARHSHKILSFLIVIRNFIFQYMLVFCERNLQFVLYNQ